MKFIQITFLLLISLYQAPTSENDSECTYDENSCILLCHVKYHGTKKYNPTTKKCEPINTENTNTNLRTNTTKRMLIEEPNQKVFQADNGKTYNCLNGIMIKNSGICICNEGWTNSESEEKDENGNIVLCSVKESGSKDIRIGDKNQTQNSFTQSGISNTMKVYGAFIFAFIFIVAVIVTCVIYRKCCNKKNSSEITFSLSSDKNENIRKITENN